MSGLLKKLLVGHCKGKTPIVVYIKATSLLLTGPLQETAISFLHFSLTLRPLISQLLSAAVLASAGLAFPGSALPLAGTSVCTTVTDQSSHQNWVKTKLARKEKKKVHFNLDQFLNPVLHIVTGK